MLDSSDLCVSFGIPIEVRKGWEGKNSRTGDSLQQYNGPQRNYRTERVRLGGGQCRRGNTESDK